jgi:hypothetical protein
MKALLPTLALIAASTLVACGGETPPAPATEKPAPIAEAPAAAEQPAAAPAPVATPTPAPAAPAGEQESFATKAATAAIPADAIGGSPVTNMPDAWVRGNEALKKYCADNGMDCANFFTKEEPVQTGGYWTMQFFGEAKGQAMYVGVRVYPDGRAEVIR